MIQIPLTPDKYQQALQRLMQTKDPHIVSFTLPSGIEPGKLVTTVGTLDFAYDGSAELIVGPWQLHGLARFASDNTIKSFIEDHLGLA